MYEGKKWIANTDERGVRILPRSQHYKYKMCIATTAKLHLIYITPKMWIHIIFLWSFIMELKLYNCQLCDLDDARH